MTELKDSLMGSQTVLDARETSAILAENQSLTNKLSKLTLADTTLLREDNGERELTPEFIETWRSLTP